MKVAIGIDLGGTQIKGQVVAHNGEEIARCTAPTEDGGHGEIPRFAVRIKEMVATLEKTAGGHAAAVGISAPGLASKDGTRIAVMPGRMNGLEDLHWGTWLGRQVPVLNDAHAALLGEVWMGAGRDHQDVILLTLGTGVGGAIWSDGRLLQGAIGRAGHFGHICLDPEGKPTIAGAPGGLENWIGNHNIRERTDARFATTHDLVAAHVAGDPFATEVWLKSVRALGCGIVSLINVVDPETIIIGGGIAQAGAALFDPLSRVMDECEWRPAGHSVKIVPAKLGEWAGTYGAAWNALRLLS
jgi:glucokinase